MLSKSELRSALTQALEDASVPDADEIADSVVDQLDEGGAFETEEVDD